MIEIQRWSKYNAATDSIVVVLLGSTPQNIVISGYLFDRIETIGDILNPEIYDKGIWEHAKKRHRVCKSVLSTCREIAVSAQP